MLGKPITIENNFEEYKNNKKDAVNKLTDIINKEVSLQTNITFDEKIIVSSTGNMDSKNIPNSFPADLARSCI